MIDMTNATVGVNHADFIENLNAAAAAIHSTAVEKGWWEEERSDGECIALMHSELSETLEGLRLGNPESVKIPGFTNAEEELADTIIRILDFAERKHYDIAGAIIAKMQYNRTRPHRHGKKF